ncbi:MAG: D-alanyl-D-alanine carboxypeptidase [Nitrospirae bacterium]|nr:D-alanyl-D-alanine carboxypeptidase [Nitrospirota bacterium]
MRQLRVTSYELRVKNAKRLILFLSLLVTCYLSLVISVFADEIESKAALVMEASTGRVLFAKNPNLKLPPASTAKLVTAMVVLDNTQLGNMVTISNNAAKVSSLRETRLKAGETMTVQALLDAALIRSANNAAYALAEAVSGSEKEFVKLMNRKAVAIGANNTKFINTTGLPGQGQQITAYDLAKILRYSLKYPVLKEIIGTKTMEIATEEGRTITLENTNKLLWSDNGAVGGKTGYTRAARHCFVYAEEKNNETVIVALLGAPKRNLLWEEAERLATRGFDVMANNEPPLIYFTKADYKNGLQSKVSSKDREKKITRVSSKKRSKKAKTGKPDVKTTSSGNSEMKDTGMAWRNSNGSKG